VSSDNVIIKL